MSKKTGFVKPLVSILYECQTINDSCFLDSSSVVVTTDKQLILLENLDTQVKSIMDSRLGDSLAHDDAYERPRNLQTLKHFRECRYQPVFGKNNIIVHGCKNEIRIYDRRMPLKSFSTIKLLDKSIPTSIHLEDQYVTCSMIPWNQKRKNNQQSVLSLFDIRNQMSFESWPNSTNSKPIR